MARSRRQKWFVLIPAVLALVTMAAMWLQPGPLRNMYDQIYEGMTVDEVSDTLERCDWSKCSWPPGDRPMIYAWKGWTLLITGGGIETRATPNTLTYEGADGETLTIHWDGPVVNSEHPAQLILSRRVVAKEYHFGGIFGRLRRMLRN